MIRYIYTFFVGIFTAIFIGMGIAVFYEAPTPPEPPIWYNGPVEKKGLSSTERQQEQTYILKQRAYDKAMQRYNRNVSLAALICAVVVLVTALMLSDKLGSIADGLLLGGIFTLLYGVGRGMATESSKYRFVVATIGLVITLGLGYKKFTRPQKSG